VSTLSPRRLRPPAITSPLRDVRVTARVGRALGIAIAIAFVTGVISHLHQNPVTWLPIPPSPAWGYQLTQGLHVASGLASIPLVVVKLFSVYPKLFAWPPARSVRQALERLSIAVLVSSMIFELTSGVANIAQWYPFGFFFPRAHYAVAWAVVGSLLVHLAVKAPLITAALRQRLDLPHEQGLSRRGLLFATGAAVVTLTAVTVGQTLPGFGRLALLAPRRPDIGPQGLPVNKTAAGARVRESATAPDWALTVAGPTALALSLKDLNALSQYDAELPIACVEGWSASARWGGVRLADVLDRAGVDPAASVRVVSLQQGGLYGSSVLSAAQARHDNTLLALRVRGEVLALDHGFPVRLIAPNRPGVLQTKWLSRIEAI